MKKQLEEILNSKQLEIQNLQQRFRQLSEVSISKENDLQKSLLIYKQRCVEVGDESERIKGEVGRRDVEWRGKVESLEREVGALKAQYGKQGEYYFIFVGLLTNFPCLSRKPARLGLPIERGPHRPTPRDDIKTDESRGTNPLDGFNNSGKRYGNSRNF